MAFLLRSIRRNEEGRVITNESRVDAPLLRVGRDTDCDLVLDDLAVALHHATIERLDGDLLRVSAEMGMMIELDGSAVDSGRIPLHAGGDIRIGPFLLRVPPTPRDSTDVAIDFERGADDAAAERVDVRRFGLAPVMPGKRPLAWGLALLVLAVFLAWPIWSFYQTRTEAARYAQGYHPDRMWLSGSLSQGHASLSDNCQACHVEPFVPVRDAACTSCHSRVHDHADARLMERANPRLSGFRRLQMRIGRWFGQDPGRCVDCHTEHEGPQRIPPTPQRFCADCHGDLRARLPRTRLASASDFGSDHPAFQPLVVTGWDGGRPRLERIGPGRPWRETNNLKFPHAVHLERGGGVARMGQRLPSRFGFGAQLVCADCHVPTPDGARFQPVDMEGDCGMCHSLSFDQFGPTLRTLRHGDAAQAIADIRTLYRAGGPQRPPELATTRQRPGDAAQIRAAVQRARARASLGARADLAIRALFSPRYGRLTRPGEATCFDCHEVVQPPPGSLAYDIRPPSVATRYLWHGWFDHRAHQIMQRPGQPRLTGAAACASCHGALTSNSARDVLLPDLASCRDCHGGEHSRAPVASSCAMCHDYHMDEGTPAMLLRQRVRGRRWETTTIGIDQQAAARR